MRRVKLRRHYPLSFLLGVSRWRSQHGTFWMLHLGPWFLEIVPRQLVEAS